MGPFSPDQWGGGWGGAGKSIGSQQVTEQSNVQPLVMKWPALPPSLVTLAKKEPG